MNGNHVTSYVRTRLDLLWMLLAGCYCGSSANPRPCLRHPWRFHQAVLDLDLETLRDRLDEYEARLEKLEQRLDSNPIGTKE